MNAKTFLPVILLVVIATSMLSAQSYHQLGFTFGSNYSTLHSDLFPTNSGRLSYAVGAVFHLGFHDRFGLSQEVIFAQKGATARAVSFPPEQKPENQSYNYYYNAFQTSILANFQPFSKLPVRLQAGGFAELLSNRLKRNNYDLYVGEYDENEHYNAMLATKLNESFSGVDFGTAVGISAGGSQFRVNL
ncbi:MAG: outer membrane beta-barrel protein, partial [Saprospiraceae bacterium]|nr:outer membrane beta-barrel protein [Saprospiraceae bacterium]